MAVYDSDTEQGTILAQKPEPGTPIDGLTLLELVVSLGPKGELVEVGDYVDKPFEEAIRELSGLNMAFIFRVRKADGEEPPGVVLSQSPEPESEIPFGSPIQLVMSYPGKVESGKVFGMFKHELPGYPILVDIRLEAVSLSGRKTIFTMKHSGGPISVPYVVSADSELVFSIAEKEESRQRPLPLNPGG